MTTPTTINCLISNNLQTINLVRPSVVVLELCHARRNILTLDEETILRAAKDLSLC